MPPPVERRDLFLAAPVVLAATGAAAQAPLPEPARAIPSRAAGRPMPHLEKPLPEPPDRRVGFAVVGLGKFALGQIIPAFGECRRARLAAIVSGNAEKARDAARRFGLPDRAVYDYASFDRVADDPSVEVVYVILPNSLHLEFAERAFRAGKHVLMEKPMAVTLDQGRRMIAAGRAANRKLMVAYRAQYENYNRKAIELIRAGELGDLRLITSDHGRPLKPDDPADQWRMRRDLAGHGALYDVGIYAVNAMRYLSGEEPAEVRAMTRSPEGDGRFAEIEDMTTWQFRMPSGLLCVGSTSYSFLETKRLSVVGTKGALRMDPATDYDHRRLWLSRSKSEETEMQLPPGNQFAQEMDHMAECVRENREPRTPGEEGMRDLAIMHAIYEAAKTGRSVTLDPRALREGRI